MLAGVFVERLVEASDEVFEYISHLVIGYVLGAQVNVLEALDDEEKQSGLSEPFDGVVKLELVEHLAHVLAEAVDVGGEIGF